MCYTGYFNSLSNALEMRTRIRSVNDKITYAAEVSPDFFFVFLTWLTYFGRCNLSSESY